MTFSDGSLWLGLYGGQTGASAKRNGGYPPYNIELLPTDGDGPEVMRITLAVAGFASHELDVCIANGTLAIGGAKSDEATNDEAPRDYLYRGLAARQFKRTFALARGVEVRKAELHNGLLVIELERPLGEKTVLKFGISAAR